MTTLTWKARRRDWGMRSRVCCEPATGPSSWAAGTKPRGGRFAGSSAARPEARIGIINIDAHLDLRPDEPGNSGTPFNQIANWCSTNGRPFQYLCVGAAEPSNTVALFERLSRLGGEYIPDTDLFPQDRPEHRRYIDDFIRRVEHVYLSLDLDALPAATMPAVSSPAARGVALEVVESLVELVLMSGKVMAVDLVEFNPRFDIDGRGARVAARLVWQIEQHWDRREDWA